MDIAQIGFKAETSDLEKAVVKLNAIRPAAAGAAGAADKLAASVEGASAAIQSAAVAAAKAEQGKATAVLQAAQANKNATKDEIAKAMALKKTADAALAAARAEVQQANAAKLAAVAAKKTEVAALAVAAAYKQQTTAARNAFNAAASGARQAAPGQRTPANDQMPNRFNTANIAAQFQDIGVTAAMGMNPLTIALQQGTQLSAILQTMESPLQGIKIAFMQLFNAISLGTIAIVALVATLIELVNWHKVAKSVVLALAAAVKTAGPYFVALAAAAALIAAPAIIRGLQTMIVWIARSGVTALAAGAQMAAAWVIALGPIAWVIAGITAVVIALNIFRQEMTKVFGFDLVKVIKDAINTSISFFVGFFQGIIDMAKLLPEKIKHPFEDSGQTMAEAFKQGFAKNQGTDWIGIVANPITKGADAAAAKLKALAEKIGLDAKAGKKWAEVITGGEKTLATLRAEQAELGMTAIAAAKLKYETELLNEARQKGINLSPAQRKELSDLAATMAAVADQTSRTKEAIDFAKDATKGFFSDMRSGLQQGKSLWESFGNAVQNVLTKILDKMIDLSIDQMFQGAGGGSGIIGSIVGGIKSLFGGFHSKGAVVSHGITPFAKGGMFTNSIVSKPTMFAAGGSFGVMGEKGPEAIMPLSRGADGTLGVRVQGSTADHVTVNVINNSSNTQVSQQRRTTPSGPEIDVIVDDLVASKIGDRGSSTRQAIGSVSGQQIIRR